jgi:hypothetical protein
MAVHGAVSGSGCTLAWLPSAQDRIYYQRGGATNTWEYYGIVANAWNPVVPIPNSDTYTNGTAMVADVARDIFVVRPSTVAGGAVKFYEFNYHTLTLTPAGTGYTGEGTPHDGVLVTINRTGAQKYIYFAKQTSSEFQRVWIVE